MLNNGYLNNPEEHNLIEYYNREVSNFKRNLELSIANFDQDAIHDMRVAVKRIRAILQLFHDIPEISISLKKVHLFDEVFSTSGKLRESQINQLIVDENSEFELSDFKEMLAKTEKKRKKKFKKGVKSFNFKKLDKLNDELNEKLLMVRRAGLVKKTYRKIKGGLVELKAMISTEGWHFHRIRTEMNIVRATCEFSNELQNSEIMTRIIDQLNPIHKKIGQWHDDVVFIKASEKSLLKTDKNQGDIELLLSKMKNKKLAVEKDLIMELDVFAANI